MTRRSIQGHRKAAGYLVMGLGLVIEGAAIAHIVRQLLGDQVPSWSSILVCLMALPLLMAGLLSLMKVDEDGGIR